MANNQDQPATRDELPTSLFPVKIEPLSRYNPQELEDLAARPQKILPVPACDDPGKARRLANLAQYKGRSAEGQKKALGNLPRRVKSSMSTGNEPVQFPEGMSRPNVPAINPAYTPLEKTFMGKNKKRVLSKEEYDLFERTWIATLTDHPEYDNPSDHHDVLCICQETVNMFRIELWEHNNPGKSKADLYQAASNRLDRARRNLADRRVDRVGSKANLKSTTNIAIMAGHVDPNKRLERQQRAIQDQEDEFKFLEATARVVEQNILPPPAEVVEAEVEPAEVPLPAEEPDRLNP